jgi:hypothetical protein
MNKTIGFDLDGTIIDHTANKIHLAAAYGITLTPEQTPSGVFLHDLPAAQKLEISTRLYTDPEMAELSRLMPGSLAVLEAVQASGQPYYLISRRKTEIVVPLLTKLGLWPGIFHPENVAFVDIMEQKIEPAKEFGLTHYVDDHATTLTGFLSFIPHKYLFDQYDLQPESEKYTRVFSWEEVGQKLLG